MRDEGSKDLTTSNVVDDLDRFLDGLEGFVIRAERIVDVLHSIAVTVKSMEKDGSLSMLLELVDRASQNPNAPE